MTSTLRSLLSIEANQAQLLQGNSAGQLPVPVRKWVWPIAAIALALGSVWGSRHIEQQLSTAAPDILTKAGINAASLEFKPSYRNMEVTGILPDNTSSASLEKILTSHTGLNGEKIRAANVSAQAARSTAVESEPTLNTGAVPRSTGIEASNTTESDAAQLQTAINRFINRIHTEIVFEPNSHTLPPRAAPVLDEIITEINSYPDTFIEIGGHLISQSSAADNLSLSQRRADAVFEYLQSNDVLKHRLFASGFGATQPALGNGLLLDHRSSQRIEIRVLQ